MLAEQKREERDPALRRDEEVGARDLSLWRWSCV